MGKVFLTDISVMVIVAQRQKQTIWALGAPRRCLSSVKTLVQSRLLTQESRLDQSLEWTRVQNGPESRIDQSLEWTRVQNGRLEWTRVQNGPESRMDQSLDWTRVQTGLEGW